MKPIRLNAQQPMPGPKIYAWQESAAQCTRCNNCAQKCPSYQAHPEEIFSPRGRVQLIRFLTEKNLKLNQHLPLLRRITSSCVLCGRCTQTCAGKIPVAHYMLAVEKTLHQPRLPYSLRALLSLFSAYPALFERLTHFLLAMRNIGLWSLCRLFLPQWLKHAHSILPSKTITLKKALTQKPLDLSSQDPQVLFLPSLYALYADGRAGWQVCQLLSKKRVHVIWNCSSGLPEYLYGTRAQTQKAVKKLLLIWEKLSAKQPLPLVTDSIEIYSFLKQISFLFTGWEKWQYRAQVLENHIQYITDFPFTKTPSAAITAVNSSCLLYPAEQITHQAHKILLTQGRTNLLECEYSQFPLPTAGLGFAVQGQPAEWMLSHVQDIARKQIEDVFCLSGWAALELNAALKHLYPSAQARHLIYAQQDYESAR